MRKKPLRLILGFLAAFLVLAGLAFYKITMTPEWTILTGNTAQRAAACRAIWQKSDARALFGMKRLLQDRSAEVRMAALEAVIRRHEKDGGGSLYLELDLLIFRMLQSDESPAARAKSAKYLLSREGQTADSARQWLFAQVKVGRFRRDNGELLQHVFLHKKENQKLLKLDWSVQALLRDRRDYPGLADLVLQHPQELEEHYKDLSHIVAQVSRRSRAHRFALSALRAIHNQKRTNGAGAGADGGGPSGFVTEAEWAYSIKPNFQIDHYDGQLALHLGEGAGGYNDWLLGEDSTVDIGTGKFTFDINYEGYYRLWVRIFMENKCGNSTGMYIDGQRVGRFSDRRDRFDQWIWMPSHQYTGTGVYLHPGRHHLKVQAFEDGVFVDKYALLPAFEDLDPQKLPARRFLYDAALPTTVSLTFEAQHMERGKTQAMTVWVRRNHPGIRSGTINVSVPGPFELLDPSEAEIRFEKDSPIAGHSFKVRLPKDAVAGEVEVVARFTAENEQAEGTSFLGAHYDWFTTGPLDPYTGKSQDLKQKSGIKRADLADGWRRFPSDGYDRYRRMDFEKAYGESQDKFIFLYTEIEVEESGEYLGLLTLDDSGFIWLDGRQIEGRYEDLQGEGRLMMTRNHINKGRHQIFVRIYQADFPDPEGEDADRESYNNWNFKWLLRKERHEIAPQIKGIPIDVKKSRGPDGAPAFAPE